MPAHGVIGDLERTAAREAEISEYGVCGGCELCHWCVISRKIYVHANRESDREKKAPPGRGARQKASPARLAFVASCSGSSEDFEFDASLISVMVTPLRLVSTRQLSARRLPAMNLAPPAANPGPSSAAMHPLFTLNLRSRW